MANYSDNNTHEFEIKAFNANRIQITYRATGSLGTSNTLIVDNVKPSLLVTTPANPLVTKGNTNVTFSADVTDPGAGFPSKAADVYGVDKGRIQLFVGRTAAPLVAGDFTAIDNGWRVTKTINSSDIATLGADPRGAKVPWHFEVEDLAGNVRESTGNRTGKVDAATTADITVESAFSEGYGASNVFGSAGGNQRTLQVSDGTTTFKGPITGFIPSSNQISVALMGGTPAAAPNPTQLAALAGKTFTILNAQLITVDGTNPDFVESSVRTGTAWNASTNLLATGTSAKNTSIVVGIKDVGGIVSDSVTASAFSVSGNSVRSVLLVPVGSSKISAAVVTEALGGADHLVFLTLAEALGSNERPTVGVQSGVIMDNAGNTLGATTPQKAADGLGPNITLTRSASISKKEVKVTIAADEQLNDSPSVSLGRIYSTADGKVADVNAMRVKTVEGVEQCNDTDSNILPASVTSDGSLPRDAVNGETDCTDNHIADDKVMEPEPGRAFVGAGTPASTTALSYTSTFKIKAIPSGMSGGKFNVYVEGTDTQNEQNTGKVGHKTDAANSAAFTFELDQKLNRGEQPKVTVSDKTAAGSGKGGTEPVTVTPDVEAVDPMIVTVDFSKEAGEYPGDTFRTVELTSASLKICNADGSCDPVKTFDLTTEVSSPDSIKFTIPMLNPKNGNYALTVKAVDTAGNDNLSNPTATTVESMKFNWKVVAAKPVSIELEPGWNLVSLPFQPGNPAINSVINATHPADIVMTYDNATQVWLVSRRDAETGLFIGDIVVMTASTAYFIRTNNFQDLSILRPPVATAAAAPPPPPAITVVQGWNLVPVVSNSVPIPSAIAADDYFGTLNVGASAGWLKALTFDTLIRTWISVTPGETLSVKFGEENPCTGRTVGTDSDRTQNTKVEDGAELCLDRDGFNDKQAATLPGNGVLSEGDTVTLKASVTVGKGYWLYSTVDGVIIP